MCLYLAIVCCREGLTPAMCAALGGGDGVALSFLLTAAIKIAAKTSSSSCSSKSTVSSDEHVPASEASKKSVSAYVNSVDVCGRTALHYAVQSGSLKAIKVLLMFRADPSLANEQVRDVEASCCRLCFQT